MSTTDRNRARHLLPQIAGMIALLLGIKVFVSVLWEYRWYFPADFQHANFLVGRESYFWDGYHLAFYLHLISAPCALALFAVLALTSAFPFGGKQEKAAHDRNRVWHRRAGKIAVALVILGVMPSGLAMAWHALLGPVAGTGFMTQSLLTGWCALATARTARRREYVAHRRWAARCTILLAAPLLLRVISGAAITAQWDQDWIYRLNAWGSWGIPLLVFEVSTTARNRRGVKHILPDHMKGKSMHQYTHRLWQTRRADRRAITLIEVAVILGIVLLVAAFLLPATRMSGEASRRVMCMNRTKILLLAMLNYESMYGMLPTASGGTGGDANPLASNLNRLSGRVALLPFLEHETLWRDITHTMEVAGQVYPPMGPAPWFTDYPPWKAHISELHCPSDPHALPANGTTNYAFCIGDMARDIHAPEQPRGAFAPGRFTHLTDVKDGTAYTIGLGEMGSSHQRDRHSKGTVAVQPASILDNPSQCLGVAGQRFRLADDILVGEARRGEWWADGSAGVGLFSTILPPNSPSCAVAPSPASDGIFSAASRHAGGIVVVGMLDGHVRSIGDDIDAGDSRHPTPRSQLADAPPTESPYGVWGALGTINGHEPSDER